MHANKIYMQRERQIESRKKTKYQFTLIDYPYRTWHFDHVKQVSE